MQLGRMSEKKLEIVKRAYDRFYDGGFHATGVDAVMADTGISKRTLYKYFGSKEELIEAVLDYYGVEISKALFGPAQSASERPREQILALFDTRELMISDSPVRGCLGIKASQEYVGKHQGIAERGKAFALYVEGKFVEICGAAGFPDPEKLGKQITTLFQGAVLLSQVYGDPSPFVTAKEAVIVLMDDATD